MGENAGFAEEMLLATHEGVDYDVVADEADVVVEMRGGCVGVEDEAGAMHGGMGG